jgi:hypothetical protein
MRWFRVTKTAGLIFLGVCVITAVVATWIALTPIPHDVMQDGTPYVPISNFWYWLLGITCFLLFLSILMSSHKVRLATFICFGFSALISVLWIRSYQTQFSWSFAGKTIEFPDHNEGWGVAIATGDGGIGIQYTRGNSWPVIPGRPFRGPGIPDFTIMFTRTNRKLHAQTSGKIYPTGNPDWIIWKGNFLDRWGINFWAHEKIGRGTAQAPDLFIRGAVFPYWLILLPFQIIPAIWLFKIQKQWRRKRRGLCAKCAYDLRSSTDKCPECGTPIPPRKEIDKVPDVPKPG